MEKSLKRNNSKSKEQPNCALCNWADLQLFIWCRGQGGKLAYTVYNNRACKKLYKKKE